MTMRLWRQAHGGQQHQMLPDWRGGLCAVGLSHIAEDIVAPLFGTLFFEAQAQSEAEGASPVRLHACRLADEELLLINAVGAIQHRKLDRVRTWVSGYVFPATARVVLPLLTRLAAALEFRGMVLPDRTESEQRRQVNTWH